MILDVGCGRGAVMTAVARRLTTGVVTGVDIWSRKDQPGNAQTVTLHNASLEGVSGWVNLVVSSLAIHNISSTVGRQRVEARRAES